METFFTIVLVILFLLIVLRPLLHRWVAPLMQRWIMGKMEDRMRRMVGMPTRKEEKKAQKRRRKERRDGSASFHSASGGGREGSRRGRNSSGYVDYLRNYAEDVEFVEIKNFSESVEIGQENKKDSAADYRIEQQVEDVEFVEIKYSSEKK